MSEVVPSGPKEVAPSVEALLADFHEDTPRKLGSARRCGRALVQFTDGSLCEVDEDGWPEWPGAA
ncbi:hypothetical protein [Nocardia australiensis]|uniref:hypothetical protein n=1 Tax=Nocardia australiensis TaxID=2887191 RepID=UPI001D150314|nr:hypothetical protein [Nocardia australiensis]